MLTISRRDARIGRNLPFRTEDHGDEAVKAADIPISGIHLSAEELNALLQEPHAHNALFVTRAGSKLADPLFKCFEPFRFTAKIEEANVVLFLGLSGNKEVSLGACKLKDVRLECKTGGLTELSCKIQSTPTLDKRIADLVDYMDSPVQIEIGYAHNAEQRELAMDSSGKGPGDEEDEDDDAEEARSPPKRRPPRNGGKQPSRSARSHEAH